jgi:hypothetical protein
LKPVSLSGFEVMPDREGGWAVRFSDQRSPGEGPARRKYIAGSPFAARLPDDLGPRQDGQLDSTHNRADYLVITHPAFAQAAQALAAFHQERGLESMVVSTEEIYDQFGSGRPSIEAIRDLVRTARTHWERSPKYVLLMGSSTVDSNGYLANGEIDFLPTPFWRTADYGYEAASDGWYVAEEDGITPTAMIGRLPVRSPEEALVVVDKIVHFNGSLPQPTGRTLFVADRPEPITQATFELRAEMLVDSCIPDHLGAERLFMDSSPTPTDDLLLLLDQGVDVLSYQGHAFVEGWSSPPVITSGLADELKNSHLFLLLSWSCFDGAFTGPWGDALAWAMVRRPHGGAAAAVSGSSLSNATGVDVLAKVTLCRLTAVNAMTLGEALRDAKLVLSGIDDRLDDTLATFNLLGDPATPNPWAPTCGP